MIYLVYILYIEAKRYSILWQHLMASVPPVSMETGGDAARNNQSEITIVNLNIHDLILTNH